MSRRWLGAFWTWAVVVGGLGAALTIFDLVPVNKFAYFAGYVVLQYVVLATAWNIMGGYMGYVNFAPRGSSRSARTAPSCSTTSCRRRSS